MASRTVAVMSSSAGPPTLVQPSFEELGQLLSGVTFCVVDLETTGSAETDAITEIGAVKVRGGEVIGEFQTLAAPHTAIPALVAVLTGITNQLVAGAPRLSQVLPGYLEFAHDCVWVAHNATFDIGFLRRACRDHDYDWPRPPVLDTVALARCIMLRDEVPNHRLATLAAHFRASTTPTHRALDDARATVDVLHGLMERVGNLGVHTLEDLLEFTRKVSPQRRAKRTWADALPSRPGVYWFVGPGSTPGPDGESEQILYVGKSVDLKRRVRSYFTAAEQRRRIHEMVQISTGVQSVVCQTGLQTDVTELRLIKAHSPRYNRRSKFPDRVQWIKITDERLPRLSLVKQVKDDGATYFGPVRRRAQAEQVMLAIYDAYPIRQCTDRRPISACALAGMGRCCAPCDGSASTQEYAAVVESVRSALTQDVRPLLAGAGARLRRLTRQQRFEEAAILRSRLETVLSVARRLHRVAAIARCAQIVAAAPSEDGGWEIHVIRWGRLAGAAWARPGEIAQAVARSAVLAAETVTRPPEPLPACTIEETERVGDWLERAGVRIIELDGDWYWPVHAVIDVADLPAIAYGPADDPVLVEPVTTADHATTAGATAAGDVATVGEGPDRRDREFWEIAVGPPTPSSQEVS